MIYKARLHWIIFLWPLVAFIACLYMAYTYQLVYELALYGAIMSLIWLFMMWIAYEFSMLTIKKKQVILRAGVIIRKTTDIPMDKIESIDIRQSLLGSLLKFGSLIITGTGGTKQTIATVSRPLTCRRFIEQQMHERV